MVIEIDNLTVRKSDGMSGREARRALDLVEASRDFLIAEWERIGPNP